MTIYLLWKGWDHSLTFREGSRRYRAYINNGREAIALKSVHRISMEGEGKEGAGKGWGILQWPCMDGLYGWGRHIGKRGSIRFRYIGSGGTDPFYFRITDGGTHAETFNVTLWGINARRLSTRTRTCRRSKDPGPGCGRHVISYLYRASSVIEGAVITVTDSGSEHNLAKICQGADIHFSLPTAKSPTREQRIRIESAFPGLKDNPHWRVTDDDPGSISEYNCIAWSVGITDKKLWPGDSVPDFDQLYEEYDYEQCSEDVADIALYTTDGTKDGIVKHAARRYGDGSRESKLGGWERITHDVDDLDGIGPGFPAGYGFPAVYYKK